MPETRPTARVWSAQPWKLAGWLVVGLLSLVLLVPVLGAIALIVPYFQARQATQDMRAWQATMAVLHMTFDEDLPIVDIQIDGTSGGPVEISPIERSCAPGKHTITVVYSHGERKRSVRRSVDLAPTETQALDLTPLVRQDMEERAKQKKAATEAEAELPTVIPKFVRALDPNDKPISEGAKWVGGELEVTADQPGSVRLFDVPLERIDQATIVCRFSIRADDLASSAYAEMRCRGAEFGEIVVQGLDQQVHDTGNRQAVEIRSGLQKGQFADSVILNLVFEGPGKVRMSGIQVLALPLQANIEWGQPSRQVELGWRIEPKKEVYMAGDIFTVTLFLRNVGAKPIHSAMPNLEVLEKLGLDINLRDANGQNVPWRWGPAHKSHELLTVSGARETTLQPNVPFELPPFTIAIGRDGKESDFVQDVMVEINVKGGDRSETDGEYKPPAQPLDLRFLLSSVGMAGGDEERLESAAFKFRVAD